MSGYAKTGYENDNEFWCSSPRLAYIRDMARARRAAPWAVLLGVLTRVAVVTPPNVVTPAFVGSRPGCLNYFVAVVGKSSDGKGLAAGVAARLIPDLLEAVTTLPVSGEGLPTMFAAREQIGGGDEGRPSTVLKCVNCRAFLDVPEVSVLGAAMGRSGSTLLGTLTSIWSGESLGGQNVNENRRIRAVGLGYRVGLLTGVQPGNADMLTREDVTGLPQRVIWATTHDTEAPDECPSPPAGTFGFDAARLKRLEPSPLQLTTLYQSGDYWKNADENHRPLYPLHYLTYPKCVETEIDADALARLHGTRPAGMDGHALFATVKTAGLLAILEQRDDMLTVSEDDWRRAKYIIARSREFREECVRSGRETRRGKQRDAYADEYIAKAEAQEMAEREKRERDYHRWAKRIENALTKYDEGHKGLAGYEIKRRTGLRADETYPTIERMSAEGRLDKVGPEADRATLQRWALPV